MSDFLYYMGTNNGEVMEFSASYYADNTASVTTQIITPPTDLSDQIPEWKDRWKTVHSVKVVYVDRGAITLSVGVSVNGGSTYTSSNLSIGTAGADGYTKNKTAYFMVTGEVFNFKLSHAANSGDVEIIEILVEAEESGKHFDV